MVYFKNKLDPYLTLNNLNLKYHRRYLFGVVVEYDKLSVSRGFHGNHVSDDDDDDDNIR
jgi:hypothetical protein